MWLLLLAAPASAQVPDRYVALDSALADLESRGLLVGEVVASQHGIETYSRRLGGAPEGGRYRIGSISKSLTAAVVMSLSEDEALTLDDPLVHHVPEADLAFGDELVRLDHLMHHTAGIGPMVVGPWAREPSFAQWWTGIEVTQQTVMHNPPGSSFDYSNGGYVLLTEATRRASQQDFEALLRARVLDPLGMADTALKPATEQLAREVPGHLWAGPLGLQPARQLLPHWMPHDLRWDISGDGGVSSTPRDLVRFAEGLRTGQLLSDESRAQLLTPALEKYAGGWVVEDDFVWHNGALSPLGYSSYLRWEPDGAEVVVLLAAVDLSSLTTDLRTIVDEALAQRALPQVQPVHTLPGWIAFASALYVPWWLGLGVLGVFAAASARASRSGLLSGSMTALGASLLFLAVAGIRGVILAVLGSWGVAVLRWRNAANERHPGWALRAVGAACVLTFGLAWSFVVVGMYALMRDPWSFNELLQQLAQ
ncbi:MAG: beta-lactamase family protein [Myxococcales bacterium]|nr:beta-lactamase family protein [Myxococcales bacterium]